MKFIAAATALFAGLAAAAPRAARVQARDPTTVTLTFWAAADNIYTQDFPTDGTDLVVDSDLSFTYISSDAPGNIECISYGVKESVTTIYGSAQNVPVGPPEEQATAKCFRYM
ncbi:hypothetical protein NKR23_g23 [Pleurostoma richardsiae]|uniref:Uncharacterized protein n=1 Tax=Pleurostoma richardsiae TaxID=41990 RepID=A0AA38S270_9PEZI|nr:hypothetical protein NKR23_g23 [Pleurostoma richardsiae]